MSTMIAKEINLRNRIRSMATDAWALLKSPVLLVHGLKKKWLIPALLLVGLILAPPLFIPVVHKQLDKIYPPVVKEQLFGLIKSSRKDDRLEARKQQSSAVIWSVAGIGILLGLVIYAPQLKRAADAEKAKQSNKRSGGSDGSVSGMLDERYDIEREIGSGTMGIVYSAFDKKLERHVALKELPTTFVRDLERRERFRREALTLAKLAHPGIVQIYDLLDDGERIILVMELVRGGTLQDLIRDNDPLPLDEASKVIISVAAALSYVHEKDIVHRDLKPANILLDEQRNTKVTDFGLARLLQESDLTLEGSVFGSPSYMSPEQARGEQTDYRTDYYSLGMIFHELLTGAPPFTGEPAAVISHQINTEPPPPMKRTSKKNREACQLVADLLNKNPDERLTDPSDVQTRLQLLIG